MLIHPSIYLCLCVEGEPGLNGTRGRRGRKGDAGINGTKGDKGDSVTVDDFDWTAIFRNYSRKLS